MSDLPRNARLFALFRVFFNCRFYYPVYFVMYTDFGLSVAEFATLNLVWAVAIVVLEIPSGALADQIGRKRLVVGAAALMVLEMVVLLVTPPHTGIVFWMFAINRVLSGAAEAAASGADEALTYDSIPAESRDAVWRRTMKLAMIGMSCGFIVTSVVGAASYSPDFVNWLFGTSLTKGDTLKIPLYLNLATALATLAIALRFEEAGAPSAGGGAGAIRGSFAGTFRAGLWILRSPAATSLMLIGLFYDSIIRVFYTVSSNIYKLLRLPEASWGLIGAVASVFGIGAAIACERMAKRYHATANFAFVSCLVFLGCLALANLPPLWGVVLLLPIMISMRFLHYFLSHYLNMVTPSRQRATVLSFRGVTMNLAFGGLTLLFGVLTSRLAGEPANAGSDDPELAAFGDALGWWPGYFAAGAVAISLFIRLRYRASLTRLVADARSEVEGQPAG